MKKNCENCDDYIVCWQYKKLKTKEEAANCKDWKMSFATFEKICAGEKDPNKIQQLADLYL